MQRKPTARTGPPGLLGPHPQTRLAQRALAQPIRLAELPARVGPMQRKPTARTGLPGLLGPHPQTRLAQRALAQPIRLAELPARVGPMQRKSTAMTGPPGLLGPHPQTRLAQPTHAHARAVPLRFLVAPTERSAKRTTTKTAPSATLATPSAARRRLGAHRP